ncbi:MAG: DUF1289 domain-containing protein [Reinekea sp.]
MNKTHPDVPSPCIRRCTLNDDDICIGCGRTLVDIRRWSYLQTAARQQVLEQSQQRLEKIIARRRDVFR